MQNRLKISPSKSSAVNSPVISLSALCANRDSSANNSALERGEQGEFGRVITVKEIKAEVPIHYLLNFSRDRAAEAVNRGVEAGRLAYLAGRMPKKLYASASSPLSGMVGSGATAS